MQSSPFTSPWLCFRCRCWPAPVWNIDHTAPQKKHKAELSDLELPVRLPLPLPSRSVLADIGVESPGVDPRANLNFDLSGRKRFFIFPLAFLPTRSGPRSACQRHRKTTPNPCRGLRNICPKYSAGGPIFRPSQFKSNRGAGGV